MWGSIVRNVTTLVTSSSVKVASSIFFHMNCGIEIDFNVKAGNVYDIVIYMVILVILVIVVFMLQKIQKICDCLRYDRVTVIWVYVFLVIFTIKR